MNRLKNLKTSESVDKRIDYAELINKPIGFPQITDAGFAELIKAGCDAQLMFDGERGLPPLLWVEIGRWDGSVIKKGQQHKSLIACDFSDQRAKQKALSDAGRDLFKMGFIPLTVILTTEAWVSSNADYLKGKAVHDDPEKMEVLLSIGMTFDRRYCGGYRVISRDDEGAMRFKDEPVIFPVGAKTEDHLIISLYEAWCTAAYEYNKAKQGKPDPSQN